jgi:hypothetical protein
MVGSVSRPRARGPPPAPAAPAAPAPVRPVRPGNAPPIFVSAPEVRRRKGAWRKGGRGEGASASRATALRGGSGCARCAVCRRIAGASGAGRFSDSPWRRLWLRFEAALASCARGSRPESPPARCVVCRSRERLRSDRLSRRLTRTSLEDPEEPEAESPPARARRVVCRGVGCSLALPCGSSSGSKDGNCGPADRGLAHVDLRLSGCVCHGGDSATQRPPASRLRAPAP